MKESRKISTMQMCACGAALTAAHADAKHHLKPMASRETIELAIHFKNVNLQHSPFVS